MFKNKKIKLIRPSALSVIEAQPIKCNVDHCYFDYYYLALRREPL